MADVKRPTILITNDDGIDAPGLRALVQAIVCTNRYNVQVCAPDRFFFLNHLVSFLLVAKPAYTSKRLIFTILYYDLNFVVVCLFLTLKLGKRRGF